MIDEEFQRGDHAPGPAGRQPVLNAPSVVLAAVAALALAHLALRFLPAPAAEAIEWAGAASPRRFFADLGRGALLGVLPLATHMLLHNGFMHLVLNSLWLAAFGTPVARRLGASEKWRRDRRADLTFLMLFVLSGVAGALAYVILHPKSSAILIGASGGVSGLLGAFVRFGLEPRAAQAGFSSLASQRVIIWTAAIVLLNVGFGAFAPLLGFGAANVAWEAHLGGYAFGLLMFPAFARFAARV